MLPLQLHLPRAATGRLPVFDELRGIAILLVVLYHAGGVLVWQNFLHGDLGVDIFLLISGAGLALGARPETFSSFLQRRVLRIFPAYWAALTLFLVCNTYFLQHDYSPFNIVVHYLGLHGFFGDPLALAINDSFWFISVVLFLYVCAWFLRDTLKRLDRFLLITGTLSATVALGLFFANQPGLLGHAGFRLPAFFLGLVLGYALKEGQATVPLTPSLGVGLLLFAYVPYMRGITFYSSFVALAIMAAYALAWRPRLSEQGGVVRTIRFLGDHSLEIFLLHQPLIRDYNYYFHGRWFNLSRPTTTSLLVGMLIALTVTLALSVEFKRWLARLPFLRKTP
jgi:peptidoglycan/LPS O-acetylase OafA/YrhL